MSSAGHNQKQTTSLVLRRHRTSTEKVRTGCITCKRRHIKCDEAKPHCSNCLRSRGHCEGYAPEGTTKKTKTRSTKSPGPAQIVWDSMQQVTGHVAAAVAQQKPPLYVNPDSPDFQDDVGTRYFGEFVDLVHATSSISASNGNLWAVIMPQLAHDNPTLRYAAMAIGALSKWHSQTKFQSLHAVSVPFFPSVKEGDAHYFNAVAYYCRSLKLQNQQASLQNAVFLSLLLLFFEMLRGNRKAALDHINHGLALLLILTTDQDAHDSVAKFATNPMPVIASVADVFTYLAPQALVILRGKFGQSPPLPNFMKRLKDKNRTLGSFMVLLSQLPRSSPVSGRIPVVFTSLDEFEHVWISFQREHTAINLIMRELIQESKDRGFDGKDFFESFHLDVLKSSRLQEFCARSREVLKVLDTAYLPLFNQIMMSENTESPVYIKAVYLRLQHLGLYIFDDPAIFLDIEALQSRTPLFREYLFLADIVLRAVKQRTKNPAHQLSLQCVLTLHLLSVSMHCRDPLVRDQAIWMLKDYPGQDGLFSTRSMYLIALKNRAVERINASEGTLMEQLQRLWRREFIFEDGGDRIVVRYMDKDEVTQIWQVVEETVDVQGDPENAVWLRRQLSGFGTPLLADFFSD